ncbi:hypothetical protein PPL_04442 [Heterostelium album PN500]|uniref:EGF-like domain-containing protein n=1 Tax=Heterostelium pallidum (strain ATCC 26659 / Pp 5 / PN500) TaxID=670386 RepID=D3B7K4_HETP5|nr:hypothetical protein PPL_04442 [Heterostelium album PN500]EFA82747.1 hypothetical protein PPL_04442 [Heterostelium album PN500]|eukprot:XP_020434864.1 hypothetical protein PPL_04442 [Heterostelium album PN500]
MILDADLLGPMVTSLQTYYQGYIIGWDITIEDDNGFNNGYVKISSNYFGRISNSGFGDVKYPLHLSEGNKYVGIYKIRISIPHNVAENYTLSLYAMDNGGNIATSFVEREIPEYAKGKQIFVYADPFMKIYGTPIERNLTIVTDPGTETESVPPKLTRFSVTNPIIDVGVFNVSTKILFEIADNTNIDKANPPTVYISSMYEAFAEFKPEFISSNVTHASYSSPIILPYGFGTDNLLFISIYGISDIYYNLAGYTPLDLSSAKFSFTLSRQFSKSYPYLERYDPISRDGGQITIYGYQFGTDINQISFNLEPITGEVNMNLTNSAIRSLGNSYIIIDFPSFGKFDQLLLVLTKSATFSSNTFSIYPTEQLDLPNITPLTPTPHPVTPTPKQCPGNPICSGKGDCKNSECKCFKNFFGPDCSSQLIPTPPPKVNPSTPGTNTTVISPNDNTLISELSIDSLRELNDIGNVVAEYKLSNYSWNFENRTKKEGNIDFIEYRYSTIIKNTTLFNITIQYFLNEYNYSYAGDTYTMSKSSLKYSISMSTYEFQTNINQLQVIISATLIGSNGDCSSKSFGTTSTTSDGQDQQQLQWIKLKVGYESLYGRFIEKAVIDDEVMIVINKVLDDQYQPISTTSTTQSFIGINIPHFNQYVLIDPDFSILVDNSPASDDPNSKCNSKSNGLNKYQIAGIAIGVVVIALSVAGAIIYITLKNKRQAKAMANLNMKMQKLQSDKL